MNRHTHTLDSAYDFDTTVARLSDAFTQKGMTIFAIIDHADAAQKAGLAMHPAKLIIFGTPKVGTPMMIQHPELALHLPLKVLVSGHDNGVQVMFLDARSIVGDIDNLDKLLKAQDLIQNTIK